MLRRIESSLVCIGLVYCTSALHADPITLGKTHEFGGALDGWNSIMTISGTDVYTNNTGQDEVLRATQFNAWVDHASSANPGVAGAPLNQGLVTPFLVRLDSFPSLQHPSQTTILAIGKTREAGIDYTESGPHSFDFADTPPKFTLAPGETVAPAFLDAAVNGASEGAVIPFAQGGTGVLINGNGSLANLLQGVGGHPAGNLNNIANAGRDYRFSIVIELGSALPSDLTNNGFVDFEDLTVLLANWNKDVTVELGNLVEPDTTPVNFEDLTVLLADWTGPGPAGSPEAALSEAVPEPSSLLLGVIATLGLSFYRRRKRRAFLSPADSRRVLSRPKLRNLVVTKAFATFL